MTENYFDKTSIHLRAPEPSDVNLIYIWENSGDETHSSLRTGPLSRFQIQKFIENYDGELFSQGALRYMISLGEETIGTIDVFDYDYRGRHAFVGIYITPHYRRKGIALMAISEVEKLMRQKVGMHSLAALVAESNTASRRLFEAAGYKTVGKLLSWLNDGERRINALIYQHILSHQ